MCDVKITISGMLSEMEKSIPLGSDSMKFTVFVRGEW